MKFYKNLMAAFIATFGLGLMVLPTAANAAYVYVGSFNTGGTVVTLADGIPYSQLADVWTLNPPVYSGVEAAALLFGGTANQYVISTSLDTINGLAWYDGWGDHSGQQFADTYKYDVTGLGYNGCEIAGVECMNSSYSAYVMDAFMEGGYAGNFGMNYVYRTEVPLPAALPLFGAALAGLGIIGRRRKAKV